MYPCGHQKHFQGVRGLGMKWTGLLAVVAIAAGFANEALAQNDAPNPYRTLESWAELPDGSRPFSLLRNCQFRPPSVERHTPLHC